LLIAAFAILSTVVLPDFAERPDVGAEDDFELDFEDVFLEDVLGDFAIAFSPSVAGEDTLAT
jgi:hypothetical protein